MRILTKLFGEVELDENKLIHFENGIIGFPYLTDFALVHDEQKGDAAGIKWLQSVQEPGFAMPVTDPLAIVPDYNPVVEDEHLKAAGNLNSEDMLVLVTITVPRDIKQMSINLKAPIVINAAERRACQVIVEEDAYKVKFPVYDILQKAKAGE